MKICVTGAAGFIGSHVVDALVGRNEVVAFDDLSTGRVEWINPKANFIRGSILDKDSLRNALCGCDAVFHLAAQTDVRKSIDDPDLDYRINFVGSKNVFECAQEAGAKVIFSSSAAVYGSGKLPSNEDDNPDPISQYGVSKLQAERICPPGSFVARLFNVYGIRGHGSINIFCDAIKNDNQITINGTGMQTRDFVYVDDVVSALILGLNHRGTFNVGSGKEYSIISVVRLIERIAGKKAKIGFAPGIKGEIPRSRADIRNIRKLGWKPKVELENGIARILGIE